MTCTCKQEIAAILRDESLLWKESGYGDGFHIGICRAFATLAARLCPPAEPASAARAALLAASEPGKPAKEPEAEGLHSDADVCKVCQGTGWVVEQGPDAIPDSCQTCELKPAPASTPAFDAVAVAAGMVRGVYKSPPAGWLVQFIHAGVVVSALDGGVDSSARTIQEAIAAALRAAHAAGDAAGYARAKAEQGPRAPKGCVINEDGEMLTATLVSAAPTPFNPRFYEMEWLWRLSKQPAAPAAAKEGTCPAKALKV